jgi:hypothetical protein
VRRSYPKLSVVTQPDVVGLLSVGSAAAPKEDVLKIGEAGKNQLVEVKQEGEMGLSTYFEKNKGTFASVLGPDGLPPLPTSRHPQGKRYKLNEPEEQTYGESYVYPSKEENHMEEENMLTCLQIPMSHFRIAELYEGGQQVYILNASQSSFSVVLSTVPFR